MLHIKLPKGKTVDALVRLAAQYESKDIGMVREYEARLEAWRKSKKSATGHPTDYNPPPRPPSEEFRLKASKLRKQAGACSASTGDVYLSAELWDEIKGDYDA